MRKKKRISDKRSAFSLMEVLVVVSIIGLLVSIILVPALNDIRIKSQIAAASSDSDLIRGVIELYYLHNGTFPPALAPGDQPVSYASNAGGGWNTLGGYLSPYLSKIPYPKFKTIGTADNMAQGYVYTRATASHPVVIKTYDGVTGQYAGCIVMRNAYNLDFLMPQQSSATTDDGGIDPDGIDITQGDYTLEPNEASCPF